MHTAALLSITSDYACALQCSSLLVYPGVTTDLTGLRIQTLMLSTPPIGNATCVGLGSYSQRGITYSNKQEAMKKALQVTYSQI